MNEGFENEREDRVESGRRSHREADAIDGLFMGLAFIWGALVLMTEITGYSAHFPCWTYGWGVFFAGAGALALLLTLIRIAVERFRVRVGQGLVFGCILLGVGLGDRAVWVWPVLLGIIGLTILSGLILRRR